MKHDGLLNEIIELMQSVSTDSKPPPVSEMTAVVRKSILAYYVLPKYLSDTRLRKIYTFLKEKLSSDVLPKSTKALRNYLAGRVFAVQVSSGNKLEFKFFVTKATHREEKFRSRAKDVKYLEGILGLDLSGYPRTNVEGKAWEIDGKVISVTANKGDTVRMFRSPGRPSDSVEDEYLESFSESMKELGLGQSVHKVAYEVNGKIAAGFSSVAGMIKKPGRRNDPGADFVLADTSGKVIKGSAISHKDSVFRSYGGIKLMANDFRTGDLAEFIEDATEKWKEIIASGVKPNTVGLVRELDEEVLKDILYKSDIDFLVIGGLNFRLQNDTIIISSQEFYKSPQIPKENHKPMLKSIVGSGGSSVIKGVARNIYANLSDLPLEASSLAALAQRLEDMGLTPIYGEIPELPEIKNAITAAKLEVRFECVPKNKANSRRMKHI